VAGSLTKRSRSPNRKTGPKPRTRVANPASNPEPKSRFRPRAVPGGAPGWSQPIRLRGSVLGPVGISFSQGVLSPQHVMIVLRESMGFVANVLQQAERKRMPT
jgi:hypothetical protein